MNPGKRRKLEKIEFLKRMVERNSQALVEKVPEEVVVVQPEEKEKIVEVVELKELEEVVETQAVKKKKKT